MITVASILGMCLCARDVETGAIPPSLKETTGPNLSPCSHRLWQAFYFHIWWGEPTNDTSRLIFYTPVCKHTSVTHSYVFSPLLNPK